MGPKSQLQGLPGEEGTERATEKCNEGGAERGLEGPVASSRPRGEGDGTDKQGLVLPERAERRGLGSTGSGGAYLGQEAGCRHWAPPCPRGRISSRGQGGRRAEGGTCLQGPVLLSGEGRGLKRRVWKRERCQSHRHPHPGTCPWSPLCRVAVCMLRWQCRRLVIRQGEQINYFSIKTLTEGHIDINVGRPDSFLSQASTSTMPRRRCREGAQAAPVSYKFCT